MKQVLVMMAAAVLVGCSKDTPETSQAVEAEAQVASKSTTEPDPISPAEEKVIAIADPIVEKAVRKALDKPEGELTQRDLEGIVSLRSVQFTDKSLKEVAKFKQLTTLNLTWSKFSAEGLKELTKLQKLTVLDLSATQTTDEGLKVISKINNLTVLSLHET